MEKYLLIFGLALLFLWGGLTATTMGGNSLLGRQVIPQALTVARGGVTYRIQFLGRSVEVGRAWLLGELASEEGLFFSRGRSFPLKHKLHLGRLDQLITYRNRLSEEFWSRKRGGNGE